MTLRPNIAQLLARRDVLAKAEEDLRRAAQCLQNMRVQSDSRAAEWLAKADELTTKAWRRLELRP